MGWRLRVVHTTTVTYTEPVRASFNEVRMTPLTLPSQTTLEGRVTVSGGAPVWTYSDYWGTFVSVFDIAEPHENLVIRAQATVETDQAAPPPPGPLPWADLFVGSIKAAREVASDGAATVTFRIGSRFFGGFPSRMIARDTIAHPPSSRWVLARKDCALRTASSPGFAPASARA